MKVIRDPQILSGFICENPLDSLPAFTHCGEAFCRAGHSLAEHSHAGFEFLYLARGSATWRVGNSTYAQEAGELFVVRPGEVHATGARRNPENHHLWVGLRLAALGGRARRLERRLARCPAHVLRECPGAEAILRGLIDQVMAFRPLRNEVAAAYIAAFLALIEQASAIAAGVGPVTPRRAEPYSYQMQKAVAYMERNLGARLSLPDLAKVAAIRSIPYFCSRFRREVGTSPAAFHLRLRLAAARDLLSGPDVSITTIAMQFGFSSSQHFGTAFKKEMKCTPREWRARPG